MRTTRAGGWIAGTVVLILAIFAITYFFLAAPRFEDAAATMLTAEQTRSQNDVLTLQNAKLKADFERLDEYKTELSSLHEQIPTTAELAAFNRSIADLASQQGVFVLGVAPGLPVALTVPTPPAAPAPPVAEPAEGEDEVSTDGGETGDLTDVTTGTVTEPAGPVQIPGLVAVPLQITVVGPYAKISGFLGALQTGQSRLFLVTGLDATQQDQQDAAGDRPAVAAGDLEMTVTGYMYVLEAPVPAATLVTDAEAAPVPLPASDRNPFAPLPGTVPAPND